MFNLSKEAEQLLIAAIGTGREIQWSRYIGGQTITVDDVIFLQSDAHSDSRDDVESEAVWLGALEDLRRGRLVRGSISRFGGGVFELTREGWSFGRKLQERKAE